MSIKKVVTLLVVPVALIGGSLFGLVFAAGGADSLINAFKGVDVTYFKVEGADFCVKNVIRPTSGRDAVIDGEQVELSSFIQTAEIIDCQSVDQEKLIESGTQTIFIQGELKSTQFVSSLEATEGGLSTYNEGEGFWYNKKNDSCINQVIELNENPEDLDSGEVWHPKMNMKARVDIFCKVLENKEGA